MNRKICVIILILSMYLANMLLINYDEHAVAESGGGGGESGDGSIAVENDFVWDRVQDFCNVVYNASWTEENNIPKGRAWATEGENYTINQILKKYMEGTVEDDWCNLTGVTKLPIGYVDEPEHFWKQYSSKIVAEDFQLTINNPNYTGQHQIPITEIFPFPMGLKHYKGLGLDFNYSFNNALLREFYIDLEESENYPFSGTLTNYSINTRPLAK